MDILEIANVLVTVTAKLVYRTAEMVEIIVICSGQHSCGSATVRLLNQTCIFKNRSTNFLWRILMIQEILNKKL